MDMCHSQSRAALAEAAIGWDGRKRKAPLYDIHM